MLEVRQSTDRKRASTQKLRSREQGDVRGRDICIDRSRHHPRQARTATTRLESLRITFPPQPSLWPRFSWALVRDPASLVDGTRPIWFWVHLWRRRGWLGQARARQSIGESGLFMVRERREGMVTSTGARTGSGKVRQDSVWLGQLLIPRRWFGT